MGTVWEPVFNSVLRASVSERIYDAGYDDNDCKHPGRFKEKPEVSGMVFDARFVCNSVGTKYKAHCGV